jgi:hypothetical protein
MQVLGEQLDDELVAKSWFFRKQSVTGTGYDSEL